MKHISQHLEVATNLNISDVGEKRHNDVISDDHVLFSRMENLFGLSGNAIYFLQECSQGISIWGILLNTLSLT